MNNRSPNSVCKRKIKKQENKKSPRITVWSPNQGFSQDLRTDRSYRGTSRKKLPCPLFLARTAEGLALCPFPKAALAGGAFPHTVFDFPVSANDQHLTSSNKVSEYQLGGFEPFALVQLFTPSLPGASSHSTPVCSGGKHKAEEDNVALVTDVCHQAAWKTRTVRVPIFIECVKKYGLCLFL